MIDELQALGEAILDKLIFLLRLAIKVTAGFVIVPLGIALDQIKGDWEEAAVPVKIASSILIGPIWLLLWLVSAWWEDFEVVD